MLAITSRSPSKYAVNGLNVENDVCAWIRSVLPDEPPERGQRPAACGQTGRQRGRGQGQPGDGGEQAPGRRAGLAAGAGGRPRRANGVMFMGGTPS